MLQVLFVDDELNVLEALRAALRPHRRRWAMHFAQGGGEALRLLEVERFDVVITDLRMPRVDGATVLRAVQGSQPWASRVVLSGASELETTVRAVAVAHQYLTKPCPAAVLTQVIERAEELHGRISSAAVRAVVGQVASLPSLPRNLQALQAAVSDGDSDAPRLARVLEVDVAMCAKVLQLVNSAFFGLPRKVVSIEEAVVFLGFDLVRNLALAGEIFRDGGADLAELEQHSLRVAALARRLLGDRRAAAEACLAGMLHDLGKVVLAGAWPEATHQEARLAAAAARPVHELEQARLGTTHAEVGAYLLGLWGLPPDIVEAVALHHAPPVRGPGQPGPLTAVAVADALVHEAEGRPFPAPVAAHLQSLALPEGTLQRWRALAGA